MAWFEDWFNSPYYHILYKNHNEEEARLFIDNLIETLHFKPHYKILDLACGKGRHAIYLNSRGYDVVGVDLSEESIHSAKKFENEKLKFFVHDMRAPFSNFKFDIILNLFTSFGYFDTEEENIQALKSVNYNLTKDGLFVLDFFNVHRVLEKHLTNESKEIDNIIFHISKKAVDGKIVKDINFIDQGKEYRFCEKVNALTFPQFQSYFKKSNLKLVNVFGDYSLNKFNESVSDRLIMIVRRMDS